MATIKCKIRILTAISAVSLVLLIFIPIVSGTISAWFWTEFGLNLRLEIITYQWPASTCRSFQFLTVSRKSLQTWLRKYSESSPWTSWSSQLFTFKIWRRGSRVKVAISRWKEWAVSKNLVIVDRLMRSLRRLRTLLVTWVNEWVVMIKRSFKLNKNLCWMILIEYDAAWDEKIRFYMIKRSFLSRFLSFLNFTKKFSNPLRRRVENAFYLALHHLDSLFLSSQLQFNIVCKLPCLVSRSDLSRWNHIIFSWTVSMIAPL